MTSPGEGRQHAHRDAAPHAALLARTCTRAHTGTPSPKAAPSRGQAEGHGQAPPRLHHHGSGTEAGTGPGSQPPCWAPPAWPSLAKGSAVSAQSCSPHAYATAAGPGCVWVATTSHHLRSDGPEAQPQERSAELANPGYCPALGLMTLCDPTRCPRPPPEHRWGPYSCYPAPGTGSPPTLQREDGPGPQPRVTPPPASQSSQVSARRHSAAGGYHHGALSLDTLHLPSALGTALKWPQHGVGVAGVNVVSGPALALAPPRSLSLGRAPGRPWRGDRSQWALGGRSPQPEHRPPHTSLFRVQRPQGGRLAPQRCCYSRGPGRWNRPVPHPATPSVPEGSIWRAEDRQSVGPARAFLTQATAELHPPHRPPEPREAPVVSDQQLSLLQAPSPGTLRLIPGDS